MRYKLYTTVDITNTGQYRTESGKEVLRWKEQNFQTVMQTLGIRANITVYNKPEIIEVNGNVVGFEINRLIRVWRFDFSTERDGFFEKDGNPVGCLIEDFDAVPYIAGLDELMEQNYAVFNTSDPGANIVFHQKQ